MKTSLDLLGLSFRIGPFGTILINDEYIWENYGIPMLSFSRFPYPEYHSSRDNMEIISEKSLNEAADALVGFINQLCASLYIPRRDLKGTCAF